MAKISQRSERTIKTLRVFLLSGGIDSTVCLYKYRQFDSKTISFDYGQAHLKELGAARLLSEGLGLENVLVKLPAIPQGLDDPTKIPDGHYAHESMKSTIVPNRNMILISHAVSILQQKNEGGEVYISAHSGDAHVYPDCRKSFLESMDLSISQSTEGSVRLIHPFSDMDKTEIVSLGDDLKVPWDQTWSCYKGGENHCGTCGTCFERREAFSLSETPDPTSYQK